MKLYVVSVEVDGLVLAESEAEAIKFARNIIKDVDVEYYTQANLYDGVLPADYEMESNVYGPTAKSYIIVKDAIKIHEENPND